MIEGSAKAAAMQRSYGADEPASFNVPLRDRLGTSSNIAQCVLDGLIEIDHRLNGSAPSPGSLGSAKPERSPHAHEIADELTSRLDRAMGVINGILNTL